jgi:hypothetical protein
MEPGLENTSCTGETIIYGLGEKSGLALVTIVLKLDSTLTEVES